jgi:hypothetical protein
VAGRLGRRDNREEQEIERRPWVGMGYEVGIRPSSHQRAELVRRHPLGPLPPQLKIQFFCEKPLPCVLIYATFKESTVNFSHTVSKKAHNCIQKAHNCKQKAQNCKQKYLELVLHLQDLNLTSTTPTLLGPRPNRARSLGRMLRPRPLG